MPADLYRFRIRKPPDEKRPENEACGFCVNACGADGANLSQCVVREFPRRSMPLNAIPPSFFYHKSGWKVNLFFYGLFRIAFSP